jgi:hypothetical protein
VLTAGGPFVQELDDALLADQMNILRRFIGRVSAFAVIALLCGLLLAVRANAQAPSLSSWNEGMAKHAIMVFVRAVTDQSSPSASNLQTASPRSIKMAPFGSNILSIPRPCLRSTGSTS